MDNKLARVMGNKVATAILEKAIESHSLWDVNDNILPVWPMREMTIAQWTQVKANFIKAVEDLFVQHASIPADDQARYSPRIERHS